MAAWPLFGLRLETDRLVLDVVTDDDLPALARLARDVHPVGHSPFRTNWTEFPSPAFERRFARYFWAQRGEWDAESWRLPFAVRIHGELVGIQQLGGREFLASHAVATSSWLATEAQGAGIGAEMREAVLGLAFDHLGAQVAISGAFRWNIASIGVSEKLGYRRTGVDLVDTANGPREEVRFELDLSEWQLRSARRLSVSGLGACLDLFGLTPAEVVGATS